MLGGNYRHLSAGRPAPTEIGREAEQCPIAPGEEDAMPAVKILRAGLRDSCKGVCAGRRSRSGATVGYYPLTPFARQLRPAAEKLHRSRLRENVYPARSRTIRILYALRTRGGRGKPGKDGAFPQGVTKGHEACIVWYERFERAGRIEFTPAVVKTGSEKVGLPSTGRWRVCILSGGVRAVDREGISRAERRLRTALHRTPVVASPAGDSQRAQGRRGNRPRVSRTEGGKR